MYFQRTKRSLPAAHFCACLLIIVAVGLTLSLTTRPGAAATTTTAPQSSAQEAGALLPSATTPAVRRLNGKIAYVSGDRNNMYNYDIWVMNPDGSSPTNLTPNTPLSAEGSPAWSPDGARITFSRSANSSDALEAGIYVMNADGSNQTRLPIVAPAYSAVWSPDGSKLAYSAERDNVTNVYVSNVDGSGEVNLTKSAANAGNPAWSPDGTQIAYTNFSSSGSLGYALNVMNADGSNQRRIVDDTAVRGIHAPAWSPDGALIMFEGGAYLNPPGPNRAYLVAPDGSNLKRTPGVYYDPAWSPDGQKIVFRTHDELRANIGVVNRDGTGFTEFFTNSNIIDGQPAWQPLVAGERKLVFTSERDGNAEIYVMEEDGSGQTNLTNNPAKDATPVWSPDRKRIAFTSDRSGRSNIYVMDADGGNVRAVTNLDDTSSDYRVYDPAWSPDGAKLVFVGSAFGELSSLIVVDVDGSGERRPILGAGTEVADPAWSPDGTRIAFIGREGFNNPEEGVRFYLFVMNADGSGKTRVATEPLTFSSFPYPPDASGPSWSPDGTRLAFVSNRDGNAEIYTVSASGGAVKRLTNNPAADTLPAWLGDSIAFTSTRGGGGRDIYTMYPDGSLVFRVTGNAGHNFDADWRLIAPPVLRPTSSSRIAFLRVNPGNSDDTDIYTSDPDGTNEVNVTRSTQKEKSPAWSPDGKLLAFVRRPDRQLFVMNADGTNARPLAVVSDVSEKPSWSPDGRRIAFIGGSDLAYTLAVVNVDGAGRDLLAPGNLTYFEVAWSPDGNSLAYVLDRFSGFNTNPAIGIINLDGTGGRILSLGENRDTNPAWSPDGSKLAFTSTRDGGNAEIYSMNRDGTNQTRLTNNAAADKSPTWSPDGQTLIFSSDRDGNFELYRMNASDGSNQQRITTNPTAHDTAPDWNQGARSTIQWRNPAFRIRESAPGGDPLVVTRLGDLTRPATVDYATTDECRDSSGAPVMCPGRASDRSDYLQTVGTLRFAPGEASQTINITMIDDAIVEGDEAFNLVLTNVTGAERGEQHTVSVVITDNDASASTPNPIDEARFFVRLHYLDFLGREPEPGGWDAWVNVWTRCPDIFNNPACDRVTISASFFRSQEFYLKGYFIYRFYRVGLGRRPTYAEFRRDLARLSAQTLAELNARKNDFNLSWMLRPDFRSVAETLRSEGYLDQLLQNAGITLTGAVTRETLLADLNTGRLTRAAVLRAIVEHPDVERAEYNGAFVTMQYFGYLKRDPDTGGFNNWLNYLKANPTDFRTMVKGFVTSIEYRARFGQP